MKIGGIKAFALFDSGSNTDAMSPDFAAAAGIATFPLDAPMTLQLGVKGSKSRIVHGSWVQVILGSKTIPEHYVDVANIDKYDLILGTPFMCTHGIILDMPNRAIISDGIAIQCLTPTQDEAAARNRPQRRTRQLKASDPEPTSTAPRHH